MTTRRSPLLRWWGAACWVVAVACGDDGRVDRAASSTSSTSTSELATSTTTDVSPPAATGLLTDQTLTVGGVERAFHVFVPEQPGGAPLVLLFHGNSGSADQILGLEGTAAPYRVWLDVAEREGLIVATPSGIDGWNDCRADAGTNSSADDVAFVTRLIDELVERFGADPGRVYASGTSNGGHFSIRLAEEIPDKVTAFAAIAAANAADSECETSAIPVSALFMNGTADQLLPYEGGAMINGALVESVEAPLVAWAERNGADDRAVDELPDLDPSDGSTVVVTTRSGGVDATEAVLYTVDGGGHIEPSIAERIRGPALTRIGPQNADIEMAEVVWAFFHDKSR